MFNVLMLKGRSQSGQVCNSNFLLSRHSAKALFIYMHGQKINVHFVILLLLSPPPQWSQRSTCPQAPPPCWTAATSRWWPPASPSEAAPPPRFSGRRSCTDGARSRVRRRPTAPAPRTCATCGSRRAMPRARSSPVWCATRLCRQSFASRTRWTFSVSSLDSSAAFYYRWQDVVVTFYHSFTYKYIFLPLIVFSRCWKVFLFFFLTPT